MLRTETQHIMGEIKNNLRRVSKINQRMLEEWQPMKRDKLQTIAAQLQICKKELHDLHQLVNESEA